MNDGSVLETETNVEVSSIQTRIKRKIYLVVKRIFDIILSILALILLSPLFLIIGILIRLEDGKAPILKQDRIGKDGKIFRLYKFRSMVKHADDVLEEMLKDPKTKEEYKKNRKLSNDPRITKVGKFIRKTSIDELPQLFNVLKGDMSIIGPRPFLVNDNLPNDYIDPMRYTVKPGIFGLAQSHGRRDVNHKKKLEYDTIYAKNVNFILDFKIFFKTAFMMIKHIITNHE